MKTHYFYGRTDVQTDRQTDERTDKLTNIKCKMN
jgi:hypothetical protein